MKASERIRAAATWEGSRTPLRMVALDLALREVEGLEAENERILACNAQGDKTLAELEVRLAKVRAAAQTVVDAFWYKVKSNSEGQAALDELRVILAAKPAGEKEQDGKE